MKTTKQEQAAFPIPHEHGYNSKDSLGLTKREYFAGLAMQAYLSRADLEPNIIGAEYGANLSVKSADELIKALNKSVDG